VRGAAGSVARASNRRSGSGLPPLLLPRRRRVSSRSNPTAARAGERMLITKADASTSSWGAGPRSLVRCGKLGHRGGGPRFLFPPPSVFAWRRRGGIGRPADKRDKPARFPVRQSGAREGSRLLRQRMDRLSLRRKHRAAARSSLAGFLHKRPLVSFLSRTAFDRRKLSANQPLSLRNGTAAIVMHRRCGGRVNYPSSSSTVFGARTIEAR
jgi:hypothetical protein